MQVSKDVACNVSTIINDLISEPGLGMFAWMCLVFFAFAGVIFMWALKSGQMDNIEEVKFEMLEDGQGGLS